MPLLPGSAGDVPLLLPFLKCLMRPSYFFPRYKNDEDFWASVENIRQLWEKWGDGPENHFPLIERILQKVLLLPSQISKCLLAKIITLSQVKQLLTEPLTFCKEKYLKGSTFHFSKQERGLVVGRRWGACFWNPASIGKRKNRSPIFVMGFLWEGGIHREVLFLSATHTKGAIFVLVLGT